MKRIIIAMLLLLGTYTYAQSPVKVACVGNSITEGPGRENPDSYPLLMQKMLGEEYEVKNFGVGGRTLLKKGDYPYWDEPQYQEVQDFSPDILVIMLGTNDSKPQNWKFEADFEKDYTELIRTLRSAMPESGKVFVCIPVPVFEDNWGINEDVMRNEVFKRVKKVAKKEKTGIIDLYKPLRNSKDLFPDGIHPNKEGARIMAETVAGHIK